MPRQDTIIRPGPLDLLVVGGGPVGASLALAASRAGLSAGLVAHERSEPRGPGAPLDARVYTLSPGNAAFLVSLGVWARIPAERLSPVHAMKVFGDDGTSALRFDAYRAGVPELGWTVEDGLLQEALWQALDESADVAVHVPAECAALQVEEREARLGLADGTELGAKLIAGCDGARSFVRRAAGIEVLERGYGQSAVVANFACERPHRQCAFQWFQGGPVLALLPLPGERVSMVWSLPEDEAERVAALPPETLCREVEAASGRALGQFALLTPARSYPLRRLSARRRVAPRVALAGDAGHVIHPLAGQGLNLGLQDARELVAVLAGRVPGQDPGELGLLRRYERRRAEPVLLMDATVDGLYRLFGAHARLASRLRNRGLRLTDKVPLLKNLLIRQAMS